MGGDWATAIAAIGGLLSVGLAVGAFFWSNRKLSAEGTHLITDSAVKMIERLETHVTALETRLGQAEMQRTRMEGHMRRQDQEMRELQAGVAVLSRQIQELGGVPKFEMHPFE